MCIYKPRTQLRASTRGVLEGQRGSRPPQAPSLASKAVSPSVDCCSHGVSAPQHANPSHCRWPAPDAPVPPLLAAACCCLHPQSSCLRTFTVLSSLPVTARRPSGLICAERTQLVWPLSVNRKCWLGRDHTCAGSAQEAAAPALLWVHWAVCPDDSLGEMGP